MSEESNEVLYCKDHLTPVNSYFQQGINTQPSELMIDRQKYEERVDTQSGDVKIKLQAEKPNTDPHILQYKTTQITKIIRKSCLIVTNVIKWFDVSSVVCARKSFHSNVLLTCISIIFTIPVTKRLTLVKSNTRKLIKGQEPSSVKCV